MSHGYQHLTRKDRVFLRIMLEKSYPKAKIAKILKVHRSTIYREIKRNQSTHYYSQPTYYDSWSAQRKYLKRRKRSTKLEKNAVLRNYVHEKLKAGWSPWQIEDRLKRDRLPILTHETIYRYIYRDYGIRNCFYRKLRRQHFLRIKRHSRRHRIPNALLIHQRPEAINEKKVFGHWECDLMIFKRGTKTNLMTLCERKSRYVMAVKNPNKTAKGTALTLLNQLKRFKSHVHSITFDQGSEFLKYRWLQACLGTTIYFCDPGSPHQKGGVENINGVIRVLLPRETPIEAISQTKLDKLVKEINSRPLKCLDYQTPQEVFDVMTGGIKRSHENSF